MNNTETILGLIAIGMALCDDKEAAELLPRCGDYRARHAAWAMHHNERSAFWRAIGHTPINGGRTRQVVLAELARLIAAREVQQRTAELLAALKAMPDGVQLKKITEIIGDSYTGVQDK